MCSVQSRLIVFPACSWGIYKPVRAPDNGIETKDKQKPITRSLQLP